MCFPKDRDIVLPNHSSIVKIKKFNINRIDTR
jgi:hypothetical protein